MLTWNELVPFLTQVGWSYQDAQMAWFQADMDRSGSLSRAEFLRFCSFPHVFAFMQQIENCLTGAPMMQAPMMGGYGAPMGGYRPY